MLPKEMFAFWTLEIASGALSGSNLMPLFSISAIKMTT